MTYLFLQDAEKMVLEMLSKHTVKGAYIMGLHIFKCQGGQGLFRMIASE